MNFFGMTPYGSLGIAPYGTRWEEDITKPFEAKGLGYFGSIPDKSGYPMTEFSTTFEINGRPITAPLLVPTLTEKEINSIASGKDIPESVYEKAYEFAINRLKEGKDPFARPDELRLKGLLGF